MCNEKTSTQFINDKIMFGKDIKEAEEVRNFALLWNMFELLIIKERKFFDIIENEIEELVALSNCDKVNYMFDYFKERYKYGGKFNIKFLGLDNKTKNRIKDLFKNEPDNINDKVYVIFHIIRKIRNNFFHGSKEFHELSRSEDLFKKINQFIILYIEKAYNDKYCNQELT